MFTEEEQPLLTGTDEEIEEFVDAERCMVSDWRSSEEEVLFDIERFLPDGAFSYEVLSHEGEPTEVRVSFRGREHSMAFSEQPARNFRVLVWAIELLQPEYHTKLFRCTEDSDTPCFLLRPVAWWNAYRTAYPDKYQKIFREPADLVELFEMDN